MDVTIYTRRDGIEWAFPLEVWYFATVMEIKQAIGRRNNFPVGTMRLYIGGVELMNNRTVEDYPIVQGSRIRLVYYDE